MHIGTLLIPFGAEASYSYFTPWFPRGGDNAWFTYEIIDQNFGTGGSFVVNTYTKNREDSGSEGTLVMSDSDWGAIGGTNFFHGEANNLRDLVRFKVTIMGGETPTGPEGVIYRILPPTWYDNSAV